MILGSPKAPLWKWNCHFAHNIQNDCGIVPVKCFLFNCPAGAVVRAIHKGGLGALHNGMRNSNFFTPVVSILVLSGG